MSRTLPSTCMISLVLVLSITAVLAGSPLTEEEAKWMPEWTKIFNGNPNMPLVNPPETLMLLKKLDGLFAQSASATPNKWADSSMGSRRQKVQSLIHASKFEPSECTGAIFNERMELLNSLIKEQSVLYHSNKTTPAIAYMNQMYQEHLRECESMAESALQVAVASLNESDRNSLQELAKIVVSPDEPVRLKSEYINRESVTRELAQFLFNLNLQTDNLHRSCTNFLSKLDENTVEVLPFLVDLNITRSKNADSILLAIACEYVYSLPDSSEETEKWLAVHGFRKSFSLGLIRRNLMTSY